MNNDINSQSDVSVACKPKSLLAIMREMHQAANDSSWEKLDELNEIRNSLLADSATFTKLKHEYSEETIIEIIRLDQAVIAATNQELDFIASQVSSTAEKNKICKVYQSNS